MTSARKVLGLCLMLAAASAVVVSAASHSPVPKKGRAAALANRHAPPAPQYIRDGIDELGRGFDGRVGIAVKSVDEGWSTGWKANELYPQQSVSKLWVAITAMDATDKGKVTLDQPVTLTKDDLTLFHQPIADEVLKTGSFTTTLGDLMVREITQSDNTANDKLMRSVGGPAAVRAMLKAKHLGAIRFYNGERALQSRIAGISWKPEYSIGNAFFDARDALPPPALWPQMDYGILPELAYPKRLNAAVDESIVVHKYLGDYLPTKRGNRLDWTLGQDAVRLGQKTGYDYALFLHAEDQVASTGRIVLGVLGLAGCFVGFCAPNIGGATQLDYASLVDLHTGEVVWFNVVEASSQLPGISFGDLRTPQGAAQMVDRLLNRMKPGAGVRRAMGGR